MRLLFLICFLVAEVYALENYSIPKESYLTYKQFKLNQEKKDEEKVIRAPENWTQLKATPPILEKYSVDDNTTLSISLFDGNIGDDLSNMNRWRAQLRLAPITKDKLPSYLKKEIINGNLAKIVSINNERQTFLIYWFTIKTKHVFVKIQSSDKIIKESFDLFVENQRWDLL